MITPSTSKARLLTWGPMAIAITVAIVDFVVLPHAGRSSTDLQNVVFLSPLVALTSLVLGGVALHLQRARSWPIRRGLVALGMVLGTAVTGLSALAALVVAAALGSG